MVCETMLGIAGLSCAPDEMADRMDLESNTAITRKIG